jgi:hypothetical protein
MLSSDAKNLLYILAFLNPDAVPETMLSLENPDDSLAFLGSYSRYRYEALFTQSLRLTT